MKINVDFSIVTAGGEAVGHMVGTMDLPLCPVVGDTVSLAFSPLGTAMPEGHALGGHLKVADRLFSASPQGAVVLLMLEDMKAGSREQALRLMAFFESEFALQSNPYG
jgi:hypothetical protein